MRAKTLLSLLLACFVCTLPARDAHAIVSWTLSGSIGQSGEVHPGHGPLSTNLMLTGGVGFLGDLIRPELGIVGAYGAIRADRGNSVKYELRPMVRFKPPVIPLYLRLIVAGLSPFDKAAALAWGGGLGLQIKVSRVSIFGEAGVLPRYVDRALHWVVEGRLGVGFRL